MARHSSWLILYRPSAGIPSENTMPKTARGLNYVANDLRPPWRTPGLPVVFNHGIGTNLGIWSAWVPAVAARHPMVRFDMRGFGQSPVPPADHRWTFDEMVDDLLEVAATTGAGKVHVVGESIGGTIALVAALKAPERFASVAVSNASHRGPGITNIQGWRKTYESQGNAAWNAEMMTNRFYPGAVIPPHWRGSPRFRRRPIDMPFLRLQRYWPVPISARRCVD
jgi:3-oxoadipate enol-lactonase